MPHPSHIVVVVEENHSLPQVIGNPAMPYLNQLATDNALATQYFADTHPSLPNYFMLTTGRLETTSDAFAGIVSDDNIVRELVAAGKTWKAYVESLPSAGYLGPDKYPYEKHHDPFAYLSDVVNNPAQAGNIVPLTQFSSDLAAGQLPNLTFLIPNLLHDAHDCAKQIPTCPDNDKLSAADMWLQQNIAPLLSNADFQNSGVFILVFDEGQLSDVQGGGGNVAMIMAGRGVKKAFQSTTTHDHAALLRTIMEMLGLDAFPGAAASAPDMSEFF